MEYIVLEIADRNFAIGKKSIGLGGARYAFIASCRKRTQAEKLVGVLNQEHARASHGKKKK